MSSTELPAPTTVSTPPPPPPPATATETAVADPVAPPPVVSINLPKTVLVRAVGAVLMIVGSFGPWVDTVFGSASGFSGDGKITGALAALALVAAFRWRGTGGRVVLFLCGLLGAAAAGYDLSTINQKVHEITFGGTQIASAGWGLYAVIAGGFVVMLATVRRS